MQEPETQCGERPEPENQLFTPGYLATFFQLPVSQVLVILRAAGVKPTWEINGIGHYDAYALLAIRDALQAAR